MRKKIYGTAALLMSAAFLSSTLTGLNVLADDAEKKVLKVSISASEQEKKIMRNALLGLKKKIQIIW